MKQITPQRVLSVIVVCTILVGIFMAGRYSGSSAPRRESGGAAAAVAVAPATSATPAIPESQAPIPATDLVSDFNRQVESGPVKMALIGEEKVPLRFRQGKYPSWPKNLDDGRSGGFFEPLAQAAREGSDGAASMLYMALKNCEHVPTTEAALREAERIGTKIYAERGGVGPDGQHVDFEAGLATLRSFYERCQGVVPEMYVEARQYLKESAERGNAQGALLYADAIFSELPDEARAVLDKVWAEHGKVTALQALAENSLPHKIAYLAAETAIFDGRQDEGAARMVLKAREDLNTAENSVSPSAFREATEEAVRLLRNPNCCVY